MKLNPIIPQRKKLQDQKCKFKKILGQSIKRTLKLSGIVKTVFWWKIYTLNAEYDKIRTGRNTK